MSDLRKAAQQALEAMDELHRTGDTQVFDLCHRETTEALRAALAKPEQKPLTDREIHDCFQQRSRDKTNERRLITRAIERAHGIGGEYER